VTQDPPPSDPTQGGKHGRRRGDIELRVPRFTPGNAATKILLAVLRHSRFRAPDDLRNRGFSRVEFSSRNGAMRITLHVAQHGVGDEWFAPRVGNIASASFGVDLEDGPSLAVFDTGRGRIGAPRQVSPRSLEDPDSALSIVVGLVPGALALGARAAGDPGVGAVLARAFPALTTQARRWHGSAADESIRIANLESSPQHGSSCFIRLGRMDRRFTPPPLSDRVSHALRWQHVVDLLQAATGDIDDAWNDFAGRHGISTRPVPPQP
jgi:hypothetical protein